MFVRDDVWRIFTIDASSISSSYPSPIVATEAPSRRYQPSRQYSDTSSARTRSRSSSRSPSRVSDRARSYDRTVSPAYQPRSMSHDRALSSRSYEMSLGYGSLSGSHDINARSIPDNGQRYRSTLQELGPTPGESKEERRKRMRELLRTLDKPSPRLIPH